MIDVFSVDALGYSAGAMIAGSAVPQILKLIKDPKEGRAQSVVRNGMLVVGGGMWVLYGILTTAVPIAVMCAIGMSLNAAVLAWAIAARRGAWINPLKPGSLTWRKALSLFGSAART